MKKTSCLLGMLLGLISQASFAETDVCKDLSQHNFLAVYGDQEPLSGVLKKSLNRTGWALDFSAISAEPMISGTIKGRVENVVVGLVSESIKSGWNINMIRDRDECTIRVSVLNADAHDLSTGLSSSKPEAHQMQDAPDVAERNVYTAEKGMLLSEVFKSWSSRFGSSSEWTASEDEILHADVKFTGTLEQSVTELMESLDEKVRKKYTVHVFRNGYIKGEDAK